MNNLKTITIVKGIPIPDDVVIMNSATKSKKYPWDDMEPGDMWECELTAEGDRSRILASLRIYQIKYRGKKEYGYRLTRERETKKKGIEVWRMK